MEDDDNAKVLEVLEGISQKYGVVNVRLNQHDKILEDLLKLFKKFDDLEEKVLHEQEISRKEHSKTQEVVHNFRKILDEFKKVNNELSEKVVGFEQSLKGYAAEFTNHTAYISDLFFKMDLKIKEIHHNSALKEDIKKIKDLHQKESENSLKKWKSLKEIWDEHESRFQKLLEKLIGYDNLLEKVNSQIVHQHQEHQEENQKVHEKMVSIEKDYECKYFLLLQKLKEEIEKAKKEMILSPESYESLQKDIHKKMELLAMDASNSVLKASVCDQQLKVVQRHIDAINQEIKLLKLSK